MSQKLCHKTNLCNLVFICWQTQVPWTWCLGVRFKSKTPQAVPNHRFQTLKGTMSIPTTLYINVYGSPPTESLISSNPMLIQSNDWIRLHSAIKRNRIHKKIGANRTQSIICIDYIWLKFRIDWSHSNVWLHSIVIDSFGNRMELNSQFLIIRFNSITECNRIQSWYCVRLN